MTWIIRAALLILAATLGSNAMAIEEPDFEVLYSSDDYEIRRYEPYLVAEVDVDGSFRSTGNQAFRILAGYIFGNNRSATEMAMTAPVTSKRKERGQKMAMTAPVTSTPAEAGAESYTYAFVMEKKYTRDTLPLPVDERVRIREVSPGTVAVRRFSGMWSGGNLEKQTEALFGALGDAGVSVEGEPTLARYDGPMTPWFMRRNEIIVPVEWAD